MCPCALGVAGWVQTGPVRECLNDASAGGSGQRTGPWTDSGPKPQELCSGTCLQSARQAGKSVHAGLLSSVLRPSEGHCGVKTRLRTTRAARLTGGDRRQPPSPDLPSGNAGRKGKTRPRSVSLPTCCSFDPPTGAALMMGSPARSWDLLSGRPQATLQSHPSALGIFLP